MPPTVSQAVPEVGQAVRVRNRLASVRSVEPFDSKGAQGRLHLVEVEYLDDYRHPEIDLLLWEAENTGVVIGRTSLPGVDFHDPDSPSALHAFVHSHRWTRLNRLRARHQIEDEPLLGVWNSAIQIHPYQLEPVLAALQMPRVSLLLADGVGLGKTIQAGLVLEELLLRRRIRRVLVLSPAMLQRQWKYELRRKFNLDFEIIDSESTFQLRRRLGIDTNPWKANPRIITSMDYLRLPDILQQFQQASGAAQDRSQPNGDSSPHAAWDLLIVDECHNFAPQGGNRSSQRTRMLREIRFLFEHRVFLSATPHNGKTVCFTGLLELLDPVRFQMSVEMDNKDQQNLREIRIRRLKSDINQHSLRPPFADELPPKEIPVSMSDQEAELFKALRSYRDKGQEIFNERYSPAERWVSRFVFSLLTKRLLSCPLAFARTWWRHLGDDSEGVTENTTLFELAKVSTERAEDSTKSDSEKTQAEEDAARHGGAWLRNKEVSLQDLQKKVSLALEVLGYGRRVVEDVGKTQELARKSDSKTEALVGWVKRNLFKAPKTLRNDERLIVFTEYKETLDFLEQRFRLEGFDNNTLRQLFGGMTAVEFETVQQEFEDPTAAVRLLLATDAASEGINMQECCRWVFHYDIPWSPSKILQRNGRVSRHGQIRDVQAHYFRCDQVEDMEFLLKVARKVQQVEEDLGSVERVFDIALQDHLKGHKTSEEELDRRINEQRDRDQTQKDLGHSSSGAIEDSSRRAQELLEATQERLGISPESLVNIMRIALMIEGQGSLEEITGRPGFFRLRPPPRWEQLVQQTLTVGSRQDRMELVFDSALVEEEINSRKRLRLKKHQVLMRLGHPVMRQAMATLSRQLHDPSGQSPIRRWSVAALHRTGFEALLVFHYTISVINELREPLHDEVRSVVFRVDGDHLVPVEDSFQQTILQEHFLPLSSQRLNEWTRTLRSKWPSYRTDLETYMKGLEGSLSSHFNSTAREALNTEVSSVDESYRYRLKELSERTREKELRQIAEALLEEQVESMQATLFPELKFDAERRVQDLENQMAVLKRDVDLTRERLEYERKQRKEVILPKRFTIRDLRVLPLATLFVIPASAEDLGQ